MVRRSSPSEPARWSTSRKAASVRTTQDRSATGTARRASWPSAAAVRLRSGTASAAGDRERFAGERLAHERGDDPLGPRPRAVGDAEAEDRALEPVELRVRAA